MRKELIPLVESIRYLLREYDWVLRQLRNNRGKLVFPKRVVTAFSKYKLQGWASLYEKPEIASKLFFLSLQEQNLLNEVKEGFTQDVQDYADSELSIEELTQKAQSSLKEFDTSLDELIAETTPYSEIRSQIRDFDALAEEEKQKSTNAAYYYILHFVITAFQISALSLYGKSIYWLVASAKSGNPTSFARTVNIDGTVLLEIDYFKNTYISLQLGKNKPLLAKINNELTRGVPAKIQYSRVYLVLSYLYDFNLLNRLPDSEVLEVLERLDIYSTTDLHTFTRLKNRFIKGMRHE